MATSGLFWWVSAGVLIVLEMFTGTFYLLMVALGFIAGDIALAMGAMPHVQFGAAALVALIAVVMLRRSRFGNWKRRDRAGRRMARRPRAHHVSRRAVQRRARAGGNRRRAGIVSPRSTATGSSSRRSVEV